MPIAERDVRVLAAPPHRDSRENPQHNKRPNTHGPYDTAMRIFISPLVVGEIVVRGDEHHYLGRVRRARIGDEIELVDGAGSRATAKISAIRDSETVLTVGAVETIEEPMPRITA